MATINVYLNFSGNAEEAFNFYKSIFGGDFSDVNRYGEMPDADKLTDEQKNAIMHIGLPVGDFTLMGADVLASMGQQVTVGSNVHLSIQADSKEEADKLFNGLAAGGTVKMPLADTFWDAYFGMLEDKYGIHWMVNHAYHG